MAVGSVAGPSVVAASVGASLGHKAPPPPLTVITEPDAGINRIDTVLASPTKSLDLVIYELVDRNAEQILVDDAARGVRVRVILDKADEESNNASAYAYLRSHGVAVRWATGFRFTHEKAAVVDDASALVMTLNLTSRDYSSTRDFAVLDAQPADVAAIEATFTADWDGTPITPATGTDLLWSPGSEAALVSLIGSAHHELIVENEEMADASIVSALVDAARRGVSVEVVMTRDSEWDAAFATLRAAGASVSVDPDSSRWLYIHAKVIVVDPGHGARAFVGSENFSVTSLLDNRELGIVTSDPSVVDPLTDIVEHDVADGRTGGTPVAA
jgi:phosphatidylserine/phosphatidylglycerophosphate/cardiolipin synthase-like enzyme